ncbi:MAG: hypothetical protein OXC01_09595 [Immundisolibacterales bacterium]|nr:hypothetical protein [Immundisolibacterales bacterium]
MRGDRVLPGGLADTSPFGDDGAKRRSRTAPRAFMIGDASPRDRMNMTRNRIVEENKLPGAPSTEWDVNGWGDPSIQGFGHDISIDPGETIFFKVKTDSPDYRIDIYRMGWYAGLGARLVDTVVPSVPLPQLQPEGVRDPATRLYDCGNWAVSAAWTAPDDAVSGIYFARLVRKDPEPEPAPWRADHSLTPPAVRPEAVAHAYGSLGHGRLRIALREPRASHIYFVVRDDASRSDILFQTADTTWQAYNRYGGHCTYGRLDPEHPRQHGGPPRAYKVSYNRPLETRHYRAVNTVFNAEYPFVRFLEANGFDVSYTTGVDSDRRGELIRNHRLFLSVGHDEYWSGRQRRNVEAARDAGVHLAFFSGNEVFWKTRFEPGIAGDEAPYRTLVTYKETHANAKIDPVPDVWTGTWRDSRPFNPEGPQPENALTGTIFTVNAWRNDPIIVPAEYARLRFWRNTDVARLEPGERAVLLKGLLGHEWDEDLDNGFRPPGLFRLSETTIDNVPYVQDCGSVYDSGTATHHLTLHRHASGALVFGAGTVQWAWGLDAHHDTETGVPPERVNENTTRVGVDPNGPDRNVRQATVNLFADMGVQPATLVPDLVRAEASEDREPPVSRIDEPRAASSLPPGPVRISGAAHDRGGGCVAAVEVSVDGGATWHPATGRETWRYEWTPEGPGPGTIRCRAVDDSGNLEAPGAGITVTIVEKA